MYGLLKWHLNLPLIGQNFLQTRQIPLFLDGLHGYILASDIGETAFPQRSNLGGKVRRVKNFIALLINHLALIVRHIVVFEQLFSHVEVAGFYLALRTLNAARHNARLNGFAVRHFQPIHDGFHPVTGKNAHQCIVKTQIKAGRTRIPLATRAATQLVVNPAGLMPLCRDDAQTTQGLDLFMVLGPLLPDLFNLALPGYIVQ